MKILLTLLAVLQISSPLALAESELIGEYQAYTESELVIELTILPKNIAILFTGYYSVEPDVADDLYTLNGSWKKNNQSLILEFEEFDVLEYEIVELLPYKEFGASGGSFGLKPIKMKDSQIKRYGLWKKKALKKFMGNW